MATEEQDVIYLTDEDAALAVDIQPTFFPDGGLAVTLANMILTSVAVIMGLFPKNRRFATRDLHPVGHISRASSYKNVAPYADIHLTDLLDGRVELSELAQFSLQQLEEELRQLPGNKMKVWPDHGGVEVEESQLHPSLNADDFWFVLLKGVIPWIDSYSAFRNNRWQSTHLAPLLKSMGIKRIFVFGLAYDYCVGFSAIDAAKEGFEVYVVTDASASVDIPANPNHAYPGSIAAMEAEFDKWGIKRCTSDQLRRAA